MTRHSLWVAAVFASLSLAAGWSANHDGQRSTAKSSVASSRREWLEKFGALSVGAIVMSRSELASASEANELPLALRDFTKLAPLGKKDGSLDLESKTRHLSLTDLATRLSRDLVEGHTGRGGYFISGDLDESIFRDDCVFVDPTNRVTSLSQYRNALRILFDPNESQVELVGGSLANKADGTISVRIRSRGVLQLPWRPYVTSYESSIVYTVDEEGLISQQAQTWSKSATKALQESFTPSLFRPPPESNLQPSPREPFEVSELFRKVNGRRPYEYSVEEQMEISRLIDAIVTKAATSNNEAYRPVHQSDQLPGKWMLVYLQPGPSGAGIDRRIPFFPEFDFNDNFQVFGTNSVVNIGQLWGPYAKVQVRGELREETTGSTTVPKRYIAQINGGEICVGKDQPSCVNLPISGEGLFDSAYLGERLRIGQNLNGGGARVVQVKLSNETAG